MYQIRWFWLCWRPRQTPAYNRICVYTVTSTGQLILYSVVYCCIVYYGGRVYGHDRAMKEAIWLQGLLDDLGIDQDLLKINCDSMNAIYLAKKSDISCKNEAHWCQVHFVREILEKGDIELQKIYTKDNPTDVLTKLVPGVKFAHCKELLHILSAAWVQ